MGKKPSVALIYGEVGYAEPASPVEQPFPAPDGVKFAAGYGADESDLKRGYSEPRIQSKPEYELQNYKDRATEPNMPDVDDGGTNPFEDDYDFRRKDRDSRGFLTRPHIPTER